MPTQMSRRSVLLGAATTALLSGASEARAEDPAPKKVLEREIDLRTTQDPEVKLVVLFARDHLSRSRSGDTRLLHGEVQVRRGQPC